MKAPNFMGSAGVPRSSSLPQIITIGVVLIAGGIMAALTLLIPPKS